MGKMGVGVLFGILIVGIFLTGNVSATWVNMSDGFLSKNHKK